MLGNIKERLRNRGGFSRTWTFRLSRGPVQRGHSKPPSEGVSVQRVPVRRLPIRSRSELVDFPRIRVSSEAQFSGANLRAPHSELRGAEFRARVELNCCGLSIQMS